MLLGISIHYFIAFMVVLTFLVVSRRVATLRRWPLGVGLAYGIGVWLFMNLVVLPLDANPPKVFPSPQWTKILLAHLICVGLPGKETKTKRSGLLSRCALVSVRGS